MFTAQGLCRDQQDLSEPGTESRGRQSLASFNELQYNSGSSQPINPYEPSIYLPEHDLKPTILESLQARCARYIEETIEHSNHIATSKHVAAFGISQGSFIALACSLYSQIHFSPFSINECPNLMLFSGTLCLLLLCSAAEPGIVLFHRASHWWRERGGQSPPADSKL